VLVGGGEAGETAEIAHEALVTQWPRYQTWLGSRDPDGADRAADKRALDALTLRTAGWAAAPDESAKAKRLATGADLDAFRGLAGRRPAWLSAVERQLVADSQEAAARQQRRERWLFRGAIAAAVLAMVAAGGAWQQRNRAVAEAQKAEEQTTLANQRAQDLDEQARELKAASEEAIRQRDAARQAQADAEAQRAATAAVLADARANLIWSRLEFATAELQPHEVDALWDLATAEAATHAAFLKQMTENHPLVLRFAQRPDPVLRAFGWRLTPAQAEAALGRLLDMMGGATDSEALAAQAEAVQALTSKLIPAQAEAALGRLLDLLRRTTDPTALAALAEAVQALAPRLIIEKANILRLARSGLAAASSYAEAIAWSRVLEALLPPPPADGYVSALVEVLKYPNGALRDTSVGDGEPASATEYLLGKLRERFPGARKLQGGSLEDALAWIAGNHAEVDLASPPARPASLVKVATEAAASLPPPRLPWLSPGLP
jgi:hypothetical protein